MDTRPDSDNTQDHLPAPNRRSFSVKTLIPLFVGIGLGLLLMFWVLPKLQPYTFTGTVIQSPDPAPDFNLPASNGENISLKSFSGKLVVLFFGYTFCPDVCPTTLATAAKAVDMLGKDADQVQVIFVSVDPDRDTPDKLAKYLLNFNDTFLGVSGTAEETAQLAALYGIYYEKEAGTVESGYLVNHTATVMVIDQEGYLKLVLPFGTTGEEMADDLAHMLR